MACKARETCANCLWLWRCLDRPSDDQRRCYHSGSAHYHQERCKADTACGSFEYAVSSTGYPKGRERKRK